MSTFLYVITKYPIAFSCIKKNPPVQFKLEQVG